VSDEGGAEDSFDMLPWLENWWNTSGNNPLYAWEALGHCLAGGRPIPDWVHDYFLASATNMKILSLGRDFRDRTKEIEPEQARKLVGEALGLWKGSTKNAFARRVDDGLAHRAASDLEWSRERPEDKRRILDEIKSANSIEEDRARRILRHGKALNRTATKKTGQN
jgi:hypothetical protein